MPWQKYFDVSVPTKTPVDYVNPYIGAISHLLKPTRPTVHRPNSMIRLLPVTSPGVSDGYVASKIYGFALNVPAHRSSPVTTLMANCKDSIADVNSIASEFDHDFEQATPYHYAVLLEDGPIIAEFVPAERAAMFRFIFLKPGTANILVRLLKQGQVQFLNDQTLAGFETYRGIKQFFYLEIDRPDGEPGTWKKSELNSGQKREQGDEIVAFSRFNLTDTTTIQIKAGISFISIEQAQKNLVTEIPHWNFTEVQQRARQHWNDALGKITITGGAETWKTVFYTALYRCFERMINITEDGQYFSAYDGQVHADDRPFYVDDWSWDSYRSLHPLRLLLSPQAEQDMLQSYVRMYDQAGWLPSFPQVYGDAGCMIGHHQAVLFADACLKGLRDFDIRTAYEGLRKNATEGTMIPWREGPATVLDQIYRDRGFFPALAPGEKETIEQVDGFERRQAVAVTLEHAYDDWCLAQLARELNLPQDYQLFLARGQNYKNLYHPTIGFMAPKTAEGQWLEPFNPKRSGGIGGRDYFAEMNSWSYTWSVPHDIPGLIELMGGPDIFLKRLNQLFEADLGTSKWGFLGQFPDATGLVGQFAMGNEPSFHIPYLYNYVGTPWRTQKRVRQLLDAWFRPDLMGICGDEDGGAMSSWCVFAVLGFYPVCPGKSVYDFGSPLFPETIMHLGAGKDLVIRAENVSARNKYIQSVAINGRPWIKPWFAHEQIANGGEIVLQMGARPNVGWGNAR